MADAADAVDDSVGPVAVSYAPLEGSFSYPVGISTSSPVARTFYNYNYGNPYGRLAASVAPAHYYGGLNGVNGYSPYGLTTSVAPVSATYGGYSAGFAPVYSSYSAPVVVKGT